MITREEYDRLISNFIVELNHMLLHMREGDLSGLPELQKSMGSYLEDLRDPTQEPAQVLYAAFGLVDEFVHADFQRVMAQAYEAHQVGESNRRASGV